MVQTYKNDVERWRAHLAAERDAQALYEALARADRNQARARIWEQLAAVEERHGRRWIDKLTAAGETVPSDWRPSWRPRVLGLVARVAGPGSVLPIISSLERGDADMYVGYADAADLVKEEEHLEALITAMSAGQEPGETSAMLASLEAKAAPGEASAPPTPGATPVAATPATEAPSVTPSRTAAPPGSGPPAPPPEGAEEAAAAITERERWHRIGGNTGTSLRAAIFGVNDGLVSNLSLVMGVAGADPGNQFVILAGVAGLLAGSFSMAAGEYVSIQSQREMFERQIALERDELEENPDEERAELSLIYQAKGLPAADADRLARTLMRDKDVALDTLAREELGLDPDELGSPWGAAISSFAAFSVGAIVPVLPYLLVSGFSAFIISVILSAIALFLVGAGVSLVTGRSLVYSAVRMVLIGGLAALVTYLVGKVIGVSVAG